LGPHAVAIETAAIATHARNCRALVTPLAER
jgi:hypothetical protein